MKESGSSLSIYQTKSGQVILHFYTIQKITCRISGSLLIAVSPNMEFFEGTGLQQSTDIPSSLAASSNLKCKR